MIYDSGAGAPWNPKEIKLTTREGDVYYLDEAWGITHGNGQRLSLSRDRQGRISAITDPSGNTLHHRYTSAEDLTSLTDRLGQTTRLT